MLGFSLSKLVVLAVIVAGVWYLFRMLAGPPPGGSRTEAPPGVTEDLLKCPVCATYVTRAAPRCGRADCPY